MLVYKKTKQLLKMVAPIYTPTREVREFHVLHMVPQHLVFNVFLVIAVLVLV